jgi:hypothetical protein
MSILYIEMRSNVAKINILNKNDFLKWMNKNYVDYVGTIPYMQLMV